eukprot:CAMPEP_0172602244 /NCGR_PEP_ID=MMETSP1068-20121228/22417_1 /TAXON_ID=35684 /ORGANISM="Pseudopedinella elastica, Strain CCMP716" /LENGTH=907 /DNA_ID=CAMNT_0013403533 /DNA_START=29 /DNA_END=2752 /DNA_ORIENTATION=-
MGRALPDLRDGLKPVHRRILFAMHELGLRPSGGYRKCARVVGEVLGKFHPHGDLSVYEALVRMAQDFVMQAPLVSGHGNFGSLDNDPPAAMRYTECKLAALASAALLADVDLPGTVDFADNFDGNEREPVILPARLPLLLVNGAQGIAVGMATNVPPHNLGELCAALDEMLDHRIRGEGTDVSEGRLLELVPAPDFPTGGLIMGLEGAAKLFSEGRGSVVLRAKTSFETLASRGGRGQAREAIVVHEVPYQCNKASLLERIAELVNDKKLLGVADLRDESDRDGVRVVIELKRDAVPAVVLNNLFQKTPLQTSFPGNFLALRHGGTVPGRFTLSEALCEFLDFRFETVRRRALTKRASASQRAHVVEGLLLAIGQIDGVISIIRKEPSRAAARARLMSPEPPLQGLSFNQSEAVLGLQLGRLTSLDEVALVQEKETLAKDMAYWTQVLEDDASAWVEIRDETKVLKEKFAVPRRSKIELGESSGKLAEEDLIDNSRSVIVVTKAGYIKRMPLDTGDFSESQGRGTRGKAGAKLSGAAKTDAYSDEVRHFVACKDHDSLLFVSKQGRVHGVKAWQVPLASRTAKGVPLPTLLPFLSREMSDMVAVLPLESQSKAQNVFAEENTEETGGDGDDLDEAEGEAVEAEAEGEAVEGEVLLPGDPSSSSKYLVMVTKLGWIKRTPLEAFLSSAATFGKRGLGAITLGAGDEVRWARVCETTGKAGEDMGDEEKGAEGKAEEGSVDFVVLGTRAGYATRFELSDAQVRPTGRSSRGVRALKLREGDEIADMDVIPAEVAADPAADLLVVTRGGMGKRVALSDFGAKRRGGLGMIATKFKANKGGKAFEDGDGLACLRACFEADEIMLSTTSGVIVRQKVGNIPRQGRAATGVRVQRLDERATITEVALVPEAAE